MPHRRRTSDSSFSRLAGAHELPFAVALRRTFAAGYDAAAFRADVLAGIVVGTVAALTGSSKFQITGPTAAFVVILAPIVTQHGVSGLLTAGLMAGVLLFAICSS